MNNKVTVIIQARVNSTRLPGKVIADIYGKPMLEFQIERIKRCKNINEIFLATTKNTEDNILEDISKRNSINLIRSYEDDVLGRFKDITEKTNSDIFIRLTGDCPFSDPELIDEAIEIFKEKKINYLSNINPPTFPDGLDIEIFSREVLIKADKFCTDINQREHVTPWIRENKSFSQWSIKNVVDYSSMRWCVDEPEDLEVIRSIVSEFEGDSNFSWKDILNLELNKPHLFKKNKNFKRNEGSHLDKSQKLWKRAKKVIPGGNMLLSKNPEMFVPGEWPTYFKKTKGCNVWDLEERELIDMSHMGVGTNILGYSNPEVDEAVKGAINNGNMSTLNCPEEVYLAEKLIELNPWAKMVRFARTGGEANSIGIRIARAYTSRDKIAICGYHGWHDWYLATNIQNESGLNEHLLPGLKPNGVPKALRGTVLPFKYNQIDELKVIFQNNNLAAVKMEVERTFPPDDGFLEEVRYLCDKNNAVLIFDECTSGFRETFGGIHQKYNVYPDMAIYGKALGNGYAITSVVGKKEIMESAQNTFISSTFWTERIGSVAALKTLEIMKRERSWETITELGKYLRKGWKNLSIKNEVEIVIGGIPALSTFKFCNKNSNNYKTFFSQEMLKKGYLATNIFYPSISHSKTIIDDYLIQFDKIFSKIKAYEKDISQENFLEGLTSQEGFKRLN